MPEFVDPHKVLDQLGLKADMTAADFGCGSGGWAIPLAQKLEDGLVFAVDIQEAPLSALAGKVQLQGLDNIRKIRANVESQISGLGQLSCDLVLLTDLLFQTDDDQAIFREAHRVLKKQGRVLVVEWMAGSPLGPREGRVSPEQIKEIAQKVGFKLTKEFQAGDYHFALVFLKP